MKNPLFLVAAFLLWPCCSSQNEITCNPPRISNGSFRPQRTIYHDGDLLRILCNFEPDNGEQVVECTRNGWSPSPKCVAVQNTCEKVSVPQGFFVQRQQHFLINEAARYLCHNGYTTPEGGTEGQTRCLEEGWNPEPKCIKTCPKPSADLFILNSTKSVFFSGDELQYECKEGLETLKKTTGDTVVCSEEGWQPTPACLPIECQTPFLDNGMIHPREDKFLHKMVVHFKCHRGFTRVGSESAQCYHFGWSPQPPICKENVKTCQAPPSILHGMVIGDLKEVYQHGDNLEVQCDISFALYGSKIIECVDGKWGPLPSCTEEVKTCRPPPNIRNGTAINVESSTYRHGETVEYQCQPLSVITGTNPAKCLYGRWEVPSCLVNPRKCRHPWKAVFEPGVSFFKRFEINEVATYRCGSNLHETKCVDGVWFPEPLCKETCPPPPQLPNAINIAELRIYRSGEEISFRCKQYFFLRGAQKIMCEDGKWQTPPHCLDLGGTCGRPPPVDNADILETPKAEYHAYESVTYQCQNLYKMEGTPTVTCQNGNWTEKPTCRVPCTASEEVMRQHNIKLRWKPDDKIYSEAGKVVEFECKRGYQPDPASGLFRVPCIDGKFQYPRCIHLQVNEQQDIYRSLSEPEDGCQESCIIRFNMTM
ncbi:complement factor H-related protein 5-like [Candoia aspera]|uniref:complement factor H-related protein 5-like n=1 Tax=Candoia aspera TaxID=51853 RepID=UPI002FD7B1E6